MHATVKPERSSFDPRHFEKLYELEERSFWFRGRSDLINWAIARYLPEARNFLEIGCGTGYVLKRLHAACPRLALTGSELFGEGLAYAERRLGSAAKLIQLDATRLPYEAQFDAIGAFDVIEHIEDDECVLRNAHAALKPGGGLFVTVPQHAWLWSETDVSACHVRRYSRSELRSKLEISGFDVARITSFVSVLLPAMLLSRKRKHAGDSGIDAELNLPAAVNAIGYATLRLEKMLIRLGIDLPVGGSLLAIARKRAVS